MQKIFSGGRNSAEFIVDLQFQKINCKFVGHVSWPWCAQAISWRIYRIRRESPNLLAVERDLETVLHQVKGAHALLGVSCNFTGKSKFHKATIQMWINRLNRRGHCKSFDWNSSTFSWSCFHPPTQRYTTPLPDPVVERMVLSRTYRLNRARWVLNGRLGDRLLCQLRDGRDTLDNAAVNEPVEHFPCGQRCPWPRQWLPRWS